MSYCAVLDDPAGTTADVATVSGWADFGAWVDGMEPDLPELRNLRAWGWADDLAQLEMDLALAIREGGRAAQVGIADAILRLLVRRGSAEVLVVTDNPEPDEVLIENKFATDKQRK